MQFPRIHFAINAYLILRVHLLICSQLKIINPQLRARCIIGLSLPKHRFVTRIASRWLFKVLQQIGPKRCDSDEWWRFMSNVYSPNGSSWPWNNEVNRTLIAGCLIHFFVIKNKNHALSVEQQILHYVNIKIICVLIIDRKKQTVQ